MSRFIFTRLLLFVIAVCGWALVGFGGWIGWRGVVLYARDPVLMGTGGGLAIGGLLVVALALAARVGGRRNGHRRISCRQRPPPRRGPNERRARTWRTLRKSSRTPEDQRLENWKLLRALALPYFLRSTTRLSRVRKPAALSAPRRPGS